jgi:hypothetical protein
VVFKSNYFVLVIVMTTVPVLLLVTLSKSFVTVAGAIRPKLILGLEFTTPEILNVKQSEIYIFSSLILCMFYINQFISSYNI